MDLLLIIFLDKSKEFTQEIIQSLHREPYHTRLYPLGSHTQNTHAFDETIPALWKKTMFTKQI